MYSNTKCNNGFGFDFKNIENVLNAIFADSNYKESKEDKKNAWTNNRPAANIYKSEKGVRIDVAAPGLNKEDFQLSLEGNILTVEANANVNASSENEKVKRKEFNYSTFKRSFRLTDEFDYQSINATYNQGVLSIEVPKKIKEADSKIKINIS